MKRDAICTTVSWVLFHVHDVFVLFCQAVFHHRCDGIPWEFEAGVSERGTGVGEERLYLKLGIAPVALGTSAYPIPA